MCSGVVCEGSSYTMAQMREFCGYLDRTITRPSTPTAEPVKKANSKPELSQLLFISIRQRELVRVLTILG